MIQLPTLYEADTRCMNGNDTPLDVFISTHQPTSIMHSGAFRNDLQQVLQQFDTGTPKRFKRTCMAVSLIGIVMECIVVFFFVIGAVHSFNILMDWISQ